MSVGSRKNIAGERYGALTAVSYQGEGRWLCRCECGREISRRTGDLSNGRSQGHRQSCGCRMHQAPIKYAVTYRDELLTLTQLAERIGEPRWRMYRFAAEGVVNERWIDEHLRKKALKKRAKELGLDRDVLSYRRRQWGDVDAVYTTPKGGTMVKRERFSMSFSEDEMFTLEAALCEIAKRTNSGRALRMAKRVSQQIARREARKAERVHVEAAE